MKIPMFPVSRFHLLGLLLCGHLAATLLAPRAGAQQPGRVDPTFGASLGLAGRTQAMALQPDGKLLVGGYFLKGIARVNADGSRDFTFNPTGGANGAVTAMALQPDGKVLIAGSFTSYNGRARGGIARLFADGGLDLTFAPSVNGTVNRFAVQADGGILLGGSFSTVNNTARGNVARLSASGALDTAFNPGSGANDEVYTVAPGGGGTVLIGGKFTAVNGVSQSGIARLLANGAVDPAFGASVVGQVDSLAVQSDGRVLLAGAFSSVNGTTRANQARVDATGALDPGYAPGVNGKVGTVILQPDGRALITGTFTRINGVNRSNVARLQTDGSLDAGFSTGITGVPIPTINAVSDPLVYVPGTGQVYIAPFGYLERLNPSGAVDFDYQPDVVPGPNFLVDGFSLQPDGKLVITGNFTMVNGNLRLGAARLNENGSFDPSFDPGLDGLNFTAFAQTDGKTLVGRPPTVIDGVPRSGLARLGASGALDPDFHPGVSGSFTGLQLQTNGKILACVDLTGAALDSVHPNTVVRLLADGGNDTAFQRADVGDGYFATLNGAFTAPLVQSDNKILIYGAFVEVNNTARTGLARLNSNGSLDGNFESSVLSSNFPYVTGLVYAVALQPDGKILVAGNFNGVYYPPNFSYTTRRNLVRLNANGSVDTSFNAGTGPDGDVSSIAVQPNGKILIGGRFSSVNGATRNCLARLNSSGTVDNTFNPGVGIGGSATPTIYKLGLTPDGKVMIAGDFTSVSGTVRNYVARLTSTGALDPTFNPGVGVPSVTALTLQPTDGRVVVGGNFQAAGGQPANALARLRPDGSLDPTFRPPFIAGDSVQTLTREPASGAVLVSKLPADPPGGLAGRLDAPPLSAAGRRLPQAQTVIKNPIKRCVVGGGGFDPGFNPAAGTDGLALCLALQGSDNRIVVAGSFSHLNGEDDALSTHLNLGRLTANGAVDASFNASADLPVRALAVQPADGKILLGGDFGVVNGNTALPRLARLLPDGAVDPGFQVGTGTDAPVTALGLQADNRIVLGGTFTTVQGTARGGLARVQPNGLLDPTFTPAALSRTDAGVPQVAAIVQQPADGKLLISGRFDAIGTVVRHNVARLNVDGSVDESYGTPTSGTDDIVRALALQLDGRALLGGDFTKVDALERAAAARLLGDLLSSLDQWRFINFGTLDPTTGPGADLASPFGDGVANLLKYALNLNAQAADASVMTPTGAKGLPLSGKDENGRLTLTFVRRLAATTPGITYAVEFADSLSAPPGTAGAFGPNASAATTVTALDETWERVTVTDSVVPGPGRAGRFARLRVTRP